MARYIVVMHGWFVDSNGFTVHEITAPDMRSAQEKAAYLRDERSSTFNKCAVKVIELSENEFIPLPQRLTMRQRLTGVVKP
ncbi:hypothetical protein [Rouxiella badensis]|uniref:hypothetical protein n=1 Tax=Rouxiella badensis TaxID=1646377 RepID=UPI003C3D8E09